jgi:hypothetical protein
MAVRVEQREAVVTVIRSRPEARNAMDPQSADALVEAFQRFERGPISPPKTGYQGQGLQILTDLAIDPAGNVWVANNWDRVDQGFKKDPDSPCRPASAATASSFSSDWRNRCTRNWSVRPVPHKQTQEKDSIIAQRKTLRRRIPRRRGDGRQDHVRCNPLGGR